MDTIPGRMTQVATMAAAIIPVDITQVDTTTRDIIPADLIAMDIMHPGSILLMEHLWQMAGMAFGIMTDGPTRE